MVFEVVRVSVEFGERKRRASGFLWWILVVLSSELAEEGLPMRDLC